jgi:hypothetical protein
VWYRETGNDADRRLPVLLSVQRLRHQAAAEARRLLRVLFLRLDALSANASRARRWLLHEVSSQSLEYNFFVCSRSRQRIRGKKAAPPRLHGDPKTLWRIIAAVAGLGAIAGDREGAERVLLRRHHEGGGLAAARRR